MQKFKVLIPLFLLISFPSWSRTIQVRMPKKVWVEVKKSKGQAVYRLKNTKDIYLALFWNKAKTKDTKKLAPFYSQAMVNKIITSRKKLLKEIGITKWQVLKRKRTKFSFTLIGTYISKERKKIYFSESHFYKKGMAVHFNLSSKHKVPLKKLENLSKQIPFYLH